MDNENKNKFKVNIEDDGFLNPSDLDNLIPPPVTPAKKKFEVHIDDSDTTSLDFDDQQPRYNGEIYFSSRKPAKPQPQTAPVSKKSTSGNKKKRKSAASAVTAAFFAIVLVCSTFFSAFAISCINDILAFGRSNEKVQINIPNDATTDEIIDILSENDLVKQKTFCKIFYKAFTFLKISTKQKNLLTLFTTAIFIMFRRILVLRVILPNSSRLLKQLIRLHLFSLKDGRYIKFLIK